MPTPTGVNAVLPWSHGQRSAPLASPSAQPGAEPHSSRRRPLCSCLQSEFLWRGAVTFFRYLRPHQIPPPFSRGKVSARSLRRFYLGFLVLHLSRLNSPAYLLRCESRRFSSTLLNAHPLLQVPIPPSPRLLRSSSRLWRRSHPVHAWVTLAFPSLLSWGVTQSR